jgi:phosphate transport system substrate-binding protein
MRLRFDANYGIGSKFRVETLVLNNGQGNLTDRVALLVKNSDREVEQPLSPKATRSQFQICQANSSQALTKGQIMSKSSVRIQALGTGAAVALLAAFASPAEAAAPTTPLYSGGGTFAEKVYRDIMNCYGNHSGTDTETGLTAPPATCNGVTPYRSAIELLYVGSGSGRGLNSYVAEDPQQFNIGRVPDNPPVPSTSDFGPFYGTGTGSTWVPANSVGTGGTNKFPKLSFAGSDDPLTAAGTLTTYNGNKGAKGWGDAKQFPSFVGAVSMPYKPAAGTWTEKGKKPSGGGNSGLLTLKTTTWCGIYTGAIADWNNAEITTDNGGVSITGGTAQPITVYYRSDSSGTSFLMANALIHQCGSTSSHTAAQTHPVPDSWETTGGNVVGTSSDSWFVNIAGILPPNFHGTPGSAGIKSSVNGTAGSVGYVSTDFVLPIDPTGPKAMNLQTWASFVAAGTPSFRAPTFKNASTIMSAFKAPSFAKGCATLPEGCASNPLAWGVTNPTPTSASAYPVGGFTFIDMYTCYASATDVDALVGTTAGSLGYFRWYFGSAAENGGLVTKALNANGFGIIPTSWNKSILKLLTTNKPTLIGVPGKASTGCASVPTGGA